MGSCLGQHKLKRNIVCRSNIEADVQKRMSKSASQDNIWETTRVGYVRNIMHHHRMT